MQSGMDKSSILWSRSMKCSLGQDEIFKMVLESATLSIHLGLALSILLSFQSILGNLPKTKQNTKSSRYRLLFGYEIVYRIYQVCVVFLLSWTL